MFGHVNPSLNHWNADLWVWHEFCSTVVVGVVLVDVFVGLVVDVAVVVEPVLVDVAVVVEPVLVDVTVVVAGLALEMDDRVPVFSLDVGVVTFDCIVERISSMAIASSMSVPQ